MGILSSRKGKRNYRLEYKNYQSSKEQKKKRAARNKARRTLIRRGLVSKGDGKDVNHRNGNALDNRPSNWQVQSRHANRSYPRTKKSKKKYKSS